MSVINVGVGQQYTTIAAAVAASKDGDVLQVTAGTYTNDFAEITHKITIQGVGGMVKLVASGQIPNDKAILITDTDVTLDHMEFSGATVRDGNGAGIRYQAGNLTVTNCYFHDNQNGILGAAVPDGTISIDSSEFTHNGAGNGRTHNIYVGDIAKFMLTNSYVHDAVVGHEVKSRAEVNVIQNNRIQDNSGSASYSIDLPNGGQATISGNLIQQGAGSQNPNVIAFGEEGSAYAKSSLSVTGNTIVNDLTAHVPYILWNAVPGVTAAMVGNSVYGMPLTNVNGAVSQSGNTAVTARPSVSTASLPFVSSTVTPTPTPLPSPPLTPVPSFIDTVNGAVKPNGSIITVGAGKMYATIGAAVTAAHDGDTVAVDAGTYTNDYALINSKIILQGVGGMVKLVVNNGYPLWHQAPIIVNADATIKNFDISGSTISDSLGGNASAIRYHAGNLTLVNDHIHGNQDGLLATPDTGGTGAITISGSEFDHNGNASGKWSGYTHNIYVGAVAQFTVDSSYIHDAVVGHEVKSRAANTAITNSRIIDGPTGTASYSIDLPNGGNVVIKDNVVEQGPSTQNPGMIAYGEEGDVYGAADRLTVAGNTILNDRVQSSVSAVWNTTTVSGVVDHNSTYGLSASQVLVGSGTVTNNIGLTNEPAYSTASPVQFSTPTPPTATSLVASGPGITSGNGDLGIGKAVLLTLNLTKNVTVTGTPTLTLNDRGIATYISGSGTSSLAFSYTVAAGEGTQDLAVTAANLNGGSIKDISGNLLDLNTTLINPSGTLQIDTSAPTIAIAAVAGDNVLNRAEAAAGLAITGSTTGVENGQVATVSLRNSANAVVGTYTAAVANNAWSARLTAAQATALKDGSYTVQANVADAAGNAATQASRTLTVDESAPTIAIAAVAGDNVLNRAEAAAGLGITGSTTGVENGQVATVSLRNSANAVVGTYTAAIANNAWSARLTAAQATALKDGSYTVQANVADAAGNAATQASRTLTVDESTPTIAIAAVAGDNVLNRAEAAAALGITGSTTGVENGQVATVSLRNSANAVVGTYTAAIANNAWSARLTAAQATALKDGSYTVQANVADAAGNAATQASRTLTVDESTPTIAIAAVAGDNVLNRAEAAAGLGITGSTTGVENGQVATVSLRNSANAVVGTYTAAIANNAWSARLTAAQATALKDGSYTVQANVADAAGNAATQASRTLTVDESTPTIAIAAVAGDNVLNRAEAAAGLAITGSTTGVENGQVATVSLRNSANAVVGTYTAAVANNAWSARLTAAQATALKDGSYTVQANVTDAAGNAAIPGSQALSVNAAVPTTPPTPTAVPTPTSPTVNLVGNYYGTISNATLSQIGSAQGLWIGLTGSNNVVTISGADDTVIANGSTNVLKVNADGGTRILSFGAGFGDLVDGGNGKNQLTDRGTDNTLVLHAPGQGFDDIFGPVLTNGDVFDVRNVLRATDWNGNEGAVGSYLTTSSTNSGHDTTLLLSSKVGGVGVAFATLHDTGLVSTAAVLQHLKVS